MEGWGFDAKEFTRTRIAEALGDAGGEVTLQRERCYHTPLGVGVRVDDTDRCHQDLTEAFRRVKGHAHVASLRPYAPATVVRSWYQEEIGASVSAVEHILDSVLPRVRQLHFSFVALSNRQMESVPVGGYASPTRQVATAKFREALCPMFSYITAWTLDELHAPPACPVSVDAFESKPTLAWTRLCEITTPSYVYRGDEVDPLICLADLFAFATDRLLYRTHGRLEPDPIQRLWSRRGPEVTSWLIGRGNVAKVAWMSEEPIRPTRYVRHPVVFLLRDNPSAYAGAPRSMGVTSLIQAGPPFESAVKIASTRNGSLKFFNEFDDPGLLADGDVLIHAGPRSKELAELYASMYEVETMTFLEARRAAERLS